MTDSLTSSSSTQPLAPSQPTSDGGLSHSALGDAGAEQLTTLLIWTYSAPKIGFGIMGMLFATYLMKFATDVLLIAPAVMGTILAASRLWDAISDPMAGWLSDRTSSPIGRRRVWMYGAAAPMGLGLVAIWSPPFGLDGNEIVIWMVLALLAYETASTAFFIPHAALGVELTPNYHERTRLFGYSHMIGSIGMIVGLGSLQLMSMADDKRTFAMYLSAAAGLVVTALVLWSTRLLPERDDFQGRGGQKLLQSFIDVGRNPHARLLLIIYGIETFGAASIGMLVPYLVEYVIPMKELMVPLLLTYTIPQFAFTPIWIRLSHRYGKKRLWLFSMVLSAVGFASLFPIQETGASIWIITFAIGFAGGCGAVVAPSIKADVIDYDEYMTGERKEGAYLAIWNLVRKSAGSMTAFLTGWVLQLVGFQPNVEQTPEAQIAIRALFALMPAFCYGVGALLFARFSFNEAEHAMVRTALAERKQAQSS